MTPLFFWSLASFRSGLITTTTVIPAQQPNLRILNHTADAQPLDQARPQPQPPLNRRALHPTLAHAQRLPDLRRTDQRPSRKTRPAETLVLLLPQLPDPLSRLNNQQGRIRGSRRRTRQDVLSLSVRRRGRRELVLV
jgi:hypothetical protein